MKPSDIRSLITKILLDRRHPMSTPQIVELLAFKFGVHITNVSAGSNLGFLRAGGLVDRRSAPSWGKPYWRAGKWNFSTENWWYHVDAVTKQDAILFVRKIRLDVEAKARDNQRSKGRPVTYRLPPRSDDMRQMIIDIGRASA